jgi:hypothetical protein
VGSPDQSIDTDDGAVTDYPENTRLIAQTASDLVDRRSLRLQRLERDKLGEVTSTEQLGLVDGAQATAAKGAENPVLASTVRARRHHRAAPNVRAATECDGSTQMGANPDVATRYSASSIVRPTTPSTIWRGTAGIRLQRPTCTLTTGTQHRAQ